MWGSGGLEMLRCFAEGPITQSLEELSLEQIDLPSSEIVHLYNLRRLRTLRLDGCFSPHLAAEMSPPTPHLPALTSLVHGPRWSRRYKEQQGPSFEWMQQRLTQ